MDGGGAERQLKITNAPLSRGMDILLATPLILWCTLGAAGFVLQILRQKNGGGAIGQMTMVADLASAAFLLQKAVLLCLRRQPQLRCADNWARAWTLIVANLDVTLLLLPRSTPSPLLNLVSAVMLLTGTVASIAVLAWLGRSFAVMPQARRLVLEGPYRLVRHPLYVTEEFASLGLALQFVRPWGLSLGVAIFFLQLPRIGFEETVLAEAFPEYRAYARRTPMFLPGFRTKKR